MKSVSQQAAALLLTAVAAGGAYAVEDLPGGPAVRQLNLHTAATRIAAEISWLHWFMLITCTVIFIAVFAVMFYSIWKHRRSKGAKPANFHESVTVEVVWTLIPFIIVILMALPATKVLVASKDTSNADLTIKATGFQWKWGYDYIKGEGEGIKFVSNLSTPQEQIQGRAAKGENYLLEVDNPVVVPVGKKVRMLLTANDVIHAWWVPALGVKQDAIPGFIRDTWFRADKEGIFRGNCAELCGKDHGFMPIEVHVLSAEKYAAWVAEQQGKMAATAEDPTKEWALAELVAKGEQVFAANCAACHQADGKGMPPAFPPLDGAAIVQGDKAEQIKVVMQGRDGTAMAAFGKQLSATDLAAVITYTRNAWSNQTGEAIQPAEIAAALN